MMIPIKNTGSTSEYYDKFSNRYDTERANGYFGFINDLEFEMISPLVTGKKVLEIGCGTGLILERVHTFATETYGVDISKGMIEVCKNKGLNVSLASATDLPFENSSFDLSYSFKVLPHVTDIYRALHEIARVTRPGGRIVLEFYNPYSLKALGDRLRAVFRYSDIIYIRHDSPKIICNMRPSGTEIIQTRGIRIFGPFAKCYTFPVIGYLIRTLDRIACDGPLKIFGGYFVVELAIVKDDS
jgi:ubiquinone/menaquinone biosynthesis C-methylase UbiE